MAGRVQVKEEATKENRWPGCVFRRVLWTDVYTRAFRGFMGVLRKYINRKKWYHQECPVKCNWAIPSFGTSMGPLGWFFEAEARIAYSHGLWFFVFFETKAQETVPETPGVEHPKWFCQRHKACLYYTDILQLG